MLELQSHIDYIASRLQDIYPLEESFPNYCDSWYARECIYKKLLPSARDIYYNWKEPKEYYLNLEIDGTNRYIDLEIERIGGI